MSPDEGDALGLTLPPKLNAFSGIVQQLAPSIALTPLTDLTTLDLMCEPLYSARTSALCAALRSLPGLTSLELWVHVPEPRAGHEAFVCDLCRSVPKLEDLHFMCTTAFGKVSLCLPDLLSSILPPRVYTGCVTILLPLRSMPFSRDTDVVL
jgi:hypothetical protein